MSGSIPMACLGAGFAFYDSAGVAVYFSGMDSGGRILPETWELDGSRWLQQQHETSPPPSVYASAMVYDERRDRIVRFGGDGGVETWEYRTCPFQLQPDLLSASVGIPFNQTLAASGGTPPYTYRSEWLLPPGLTVSATGSFGGTPTEAGSYDVFVNVTDATGCDRTLPVHLDVCEISLYPTTLPPAILGTAYAATLTGSGGQPPYAFALVAGALPEGMTLDPLTGAIAGVPSARGSGTLTFEVVDATGCRRTRNYGIDAVCFMLLDGSLPGGRVGRAYRHDLAPGGGAAPFTFTARDPLPSGLVLDAAGTIAGTPTNGGSHAFTIDVADANGCVEVGDFMLRIGAQADHLVGEPLAPSSGNLVRLVEPGGTPSTSASSRTPPVGGARTSRPATSTGTATPRSSRGPVPERATGRTSEDGATRVSPFRPSPSTLTGP